MTAPKGPLASKNNLTGVTQVDVTLANSTAKTWTHNFGASPLMVNVVNSQGALVALEAADDTNTGVKTTSNANAIVLTPGSAAAGTYSVLIWWALPTSLNVNAAPAANFA